MKQPVKNIDLNEKVFAASPDNFEALALELFQFQYQNNAVYRQYCDLMKTDPATVDILTQIPFLPISFFKTHEIKSTTFEPELIFESSGTTNTVNSKHLVKDVALYKTSFTKTFERFYGPAENWCILGLLPSYLERGNSSLVLMVDELIKASNNELSGFYLYDTEKLQRTLMYNELSKKKTLLIGVTYALLDFAEAYEMQLRHTVIMETGGMKGRREEMTRQQVHTFLQQRLGVTLVHSEYGMTELLSQAYSKGDGIFHCPAWMKVLLRAEDDPLAVQANDAASSTSMTGVINIIDLANIYSCAFIATDDAGKLHGNGNFEVLGRIDNSDVRGCSLMVL